MPAGRLQFKEFPVVSRFEIRIADVERELSQLAAGSTTPNAAD